MTLTFKHLRAVVMTYSRAKVQGQRSVDSKERVETNGQTDGGDCITSLANSVGDHGGVLKKYIDPRTRGLKLCGGRVAGINIRNRSLDRQTVRRTDTRRYFPLCGLDAPSVMILDLSLIHI